LNVFFDNPVFIHIGVLEGTNKTGAFAAMTVVVSISSAIPFDIFL
jgi:hypothetical protein